ncbi:MAG: hypothetical protein AAB392_01150 [Patescibacteria group bacterium]
MPFWQRVVQAWGNFLLGSPVRTLVLIGIAVLVFKPSILLGVVVYIMNEVVAPLFHGLLPWFLTIALCLWVWGKVRPQKGGKRK